MNNARVAWGALFAQDQWTLRRLTLQGGRAVRSIVELVPRAAGRAVAVSAYAHLPPEDTGVDSYKDVTLRMGAAYDLAGNGKTVLKVSLGKYLEGAGVTGTYANTNPSLRMPQTTPVFGTGRGDACMDRCQPQLRARLRPAEPRRPGPAGERWRCLRRDLEHAVRPERADQQLRSAAS